MQERTPPPDRTARTIAYLGMSAFTCVLLVTLFQMWTAKDRPVPAEVQGCYANGPQTMRVYATRIVVNARPDPEVLVRFVRTNIGPLIETIDSAIQLDARLPPHKQIGRGTIIRIQGNTLLAFAEDGGAIPFKKADTSAACRETDNLSDPPDPRTTQQQNLM